jgi:hypothetical protein
VNRCGATPISPERRYRVGDGSGEAYLLERGDEMARISYPSGATRRVCVADLAVRGRPTPNERQLLEWAIAQDGRLDWPAARYRVAVVTLRNAGCLIEDGWTLLLTEKGRQAAEKLRPAPW